MIVVGQRICHICGVAEPQFPVITTRAATVRMALAAGLSPTTSESYQGRSYFLSCRLVDESGETLASLYGIHFLHDTGSRSAWQHRRDYGRVVEAELAQEALSQEESAIAESVA